jgi:DNA-binding transcriptional MerR regulator
MSHFVNKCSCGKVLSSCRCFSKEKIVNVVEDGCEDCKTKKSAQVQVDLIEGLKNALLQQWMQQMGIAITKVKDVLEEHESPNEDDETSDDSDGEWSEEAVEDEEPIEKESKEPDQIAVELKEEHENDEDEPDQIAVEIRKVHTNE